MWFFVIILNLIFIIEWFLFFDEVDQFGEMMKLQLDLCIEVVNFFRFCKNFKERMMVFFFFLYVEFCIRNVLIEEFVYGIFLVEFMVNGGGVFQ